MHDLVPTKDYQYGIYNFEHFNPVQSKVFQILENDTNVIVASPTASGKTICGEIIAGRALKNGKKVIYTSPLKALVEEKMEEWSDENHPWMAEKHFVMTGDYKMTPAKEEQLNDASVIICTYEMLSVRCRRSSVENLEWLANTDVLVIDEAHFISSEGRGDHLESALIGFVRLNPTARIVFLSATMRNCGQITSWLSALNGKPTSLIESDYRPCKLQIHFHPFKVPSGIPAWKRYNEKEDLKLDTLMDVLGNHQEDSWLIFVHSKAAGKKILSHLKLNRLKCEFHNADLSLENRRKVENGFKNRQIQYLIATSTLAYGLNLPARRVAIFGVERGFDEVDVLDIIQECGRAGRPRYDTEGDAYIILEDAQLNSWKNYIQAGVDVLSKLHSKIGFHLIGEIAEKRVSSSSAALEWGKKTLSAHQGLWRPNEVNSLFTSFEKNSLITTQEGDWDKPGNIEYKATPLGLIASRNYFDPFDVADWNKNIWNTRSRDLIRDNVGISWMLTNISSNAKGYVPKEMKTLVNEYLNELKTKNCFVRGDSALCKGAVLWKLLSGDSDAVSNFVSVRIPLVNDCERIVSCLSQIDTYCHSKREHAYWNALVFRIKYGVGWKAADLCRIDGIGKHYAESLIFNDVNSSEEFVSKKGVVADTLPEGVFSKAYASALRLLNPVTDWDSNDVESTELIP